VEVRVPLAGQMKPWADAVRLIVPTGADAEELSLTPWARRIFAASASD